MKNYFLFAAFLLCGAALFAESFAPFFNWSLFWSGSWEESKTLNNRGEIKLNFLSPGLLVRGGVLDRRPLNFELAPPQGESWSAIWGDPKKQITNIIGGLYHKPTGSRLLYGVLDEWGLPARIRNPWIRSAPYSENHKPIIADLKTAASSTKEDEAYLYLSSPTINISPNTKLRGFVSAQTEIENLLPAFGGGLDFTFAKKTELLLETFYTQKTLPSTKSSSWFSNPPPLPQRDFRLSAAGLLYNSPNFSISTDWAYSETFAWGNDIYGNLGVTLTPLLAFGAKTRPLSVSFAADGGGERFICRDGVNHGAGFRSAGKVEWKGTGSSLLRVNTTVRGPGFGEAFNRSSSGFLYRFPTRTKNSSAVRLTRISLLIDRNAANPKKINDNLSGNLGISLFFPQMAKTGPLGVYFSGSIKGLASDSSSPYPWIEERDFYTAGGACEFTLSPRNFQIKSKIGYSAYAKKDEVWDFSLSAAARFKYGRFSIKAASPDFPETWNWTISWRLEKR
ncbi:MAG: hypothetical protein LBI04_03545 [Treponema sp.]|jgi:hypothetical protein|nr:hypothetical protein [Treponema sp.]